MTQLTDQRVPEWFIGGPLHGRDKVARFGPAAGPIILSPEPELPLDRLDERSRERDYRYEKQRFHLGHRVFTLWVGIGEMDPLTRLADLLLAPHLVPADG